MADEPKTGGNSTTARITALSKRADDADMRCENLERRFERSFETIESRMTEIENVIERLASNKSWWSDAKKRLGSK